MNPEPAYFKNDLLSWHELDWWSNLVCENDVIVGLILDTLEGQKHAVWK